MAWGQVLRDYREIDALGAAPGGGSLACDSITP